MLDYRPVDLINDRDVILEFHCLATFETESPWTRPMPYAAYRSLWFQGNESEAFLQELTDSMDDPRNIAEIWEESGRAAGFLWVTFAAARDVPVALVRDADVSLEHQRQGIGTLMLQHAEDLARERGARVLRSSVSPENVNSQGVHANLGYT